MRDPFLLDLPAVVSFSGGRTSGVMLRKILDAFDGQPDELKVCFQNTGLEHAATYDFVERCSKEWSVEIVWLEYCLGPDREHAFRVVTPQTASRNGEPFDALIEKKQYLPNPVARVCTANLKIRTLDRYLKTLPAFCDEYTNAVGLRADEPRRVSRMKADNSREDVVCPLYEAGIEERQVLDFWASQPFDLDLPLSGNSAGNCVGCFLKGPHKLLTLMRELPEYFEWWARAETLALNSATDGARFRNDRPSYAAMMERARRQGILPFDLPDEDTVPCFCTD